MVNCRCCPRIFCDREIETVVETRAGYGYPKIVKLFTGISLSIPAMHSIQVVGKTFCLYASCIECHICGSMVNKPFSFVFDESKYNYANE